MNVKEWNVEYAPIWAMTQELIKQLKNRDYDYKMEYQTLLSVNDEEGNQETEYFPVPVICVKEQLDVAIHPFGVMLTIVMKKEEALGFRFSSLLPKHFEIHGVMNPSVVFYQPNASFSNIKEELLKSDEQEIGITFVFPLTEDVAEILDVIEFAFHV